MMRRAVGVAMFAAAALCCAVSVGSQAAQPVVAVEAFTGRMLESNNGNWVVNPSGPRGVSALLVTDMTVTKSDCDVRIAEWLRRADAIREVELGQSGRVDPATAPAVGQLLQPDVFVRGTVNGNETTLSWNLQLVTGVGGKVIGEIKGSAPIEDFGTFTEKIAQEIFDRVCKAEVGYAMAGVMDEGTIEGTICGELDKPFTAISPEVGGNWDFVPASADAGAFSYTAANVGGVSGSGGGSYSVVRAGERAVRIQLAGEGAIHSPLGTFTATITESIALTPVNGCGRTGDK